MPKRDFAFDDTGEAWDYCVENPGRFESFLRNLEVLRLIDCQQEIHDLSFLRRLPKLRVLELGKVDWKLVEELHNGKKA